MSVLATGRTAVLLFRQVCFSDSPLLQHLRFQVFSNASPLLLEILVVIELPSEIANTRVPATGRALCTLRFRLLHRLRSYFPSVYTWYKTNTTRFWVLASASPPLPPSGGSVVVH